VKAVLREITNMPAIRDKSAVRSSVIPSAKYCCSRSSLRLVKGKTTIDMRGAMIGGEIGVASGALDAARKMLAEPETTIKEVAETFRVNRATIYRSLGFGSFGSRVSR
jgi:hypothetical protein